MDDEDLLEETEPDDLLTDDEDLLPNDEELLLPLDLTDEDLVFPKLLLLLEEERFIMELEELLPEDLLIIDPPVERLPDETFAERLLTALPWLLLLTVVLLLFVLLYAGLVLILGFEYVGLYDLLVLLYSGFEAALVVVFTLVRLADELLTDLSPGSVALRTLVLLDTTVLLAVLLLPSPELTFTDSPLLAVLLDEEFTAVLLLWEVPLT